MAQATTIEWCDVSWNPTHGCSKVSPGCAHCYAESLSRRFRQTPAPWTPENAVENVILKPGKLDEPLRLNRDLGDAARAAGLREGKLVFVNSMSDLFHEQVPDEYIARVFGVMAAARWHTFQVLTKRPERMAALLAHPEFENVMRRASGEVGHELPLPNVWLGVSIENRAFVYRADLLRATPAAVRFISAEPLLGPLVPPNGPLGDRLGGRSRYPTRAGALNLAGIDWLIVGGESGSRHRPVDPVWVRDLRDAAVAAGTAYFLKQWGGLRPKAGGRELDGRTYDEMPRSAHA